MLLRDPPIYDSLREHTLRLERQIKQRCVGCHQVAIMEPELAPAPPVAYVDRPT
jgi:hypothetical protein